MSQNLSDPLRLETNVKEDLDSMNYLTKKKYKEP